MNPRDAAREILYRLGETRRSSARAWTARIIQQAINDDPVRRDALEACKIACGADARDDEGCFDDCMLSSMYTEGCFDIAADAILKAHGHT